MRIVPPVGASSPAIILSVVVLPQPDGPSSVVKVPAATEKLIPRTATDSPLAPYALVTLMNSIPAAWVMMGSVWAIPFVVENAGAASCRHDRQWHRHDR